MVTEKSGQILQPGWVQGHWLSVDDGFSSFPSKWENVLSDWDLSLTWGPRVYLRISAWSDHLIGCFEERKSWWSRKKSPWALAPDIPDLKSGSSSHWILGKASLSLQNGDILQLPVLLLMSAGEDKVLVKYLVCSRSSLTFAREPTLTQKSQVWRQLSSVIQCVFIWLKTV